MDRRPASAGLLFGAMVFKPHLALMLPLAFLFAHRWTTLAAAALAAAGLSVLSLLVFGAPAWSAFLADSSLARSALENNLVGNEKMQSVFAAVRLLHGSLGLAWGLQAAAALGAAGALLYLQRRAFRSSCEAAAVVCAGLLATPFLLDYDLTLMAIPLACLLREGFRVGFFPFEKAVMAFAFLLPLISRLAAGALALPLAPLTIAALLVLAVRRDLKSVGEAEPPISTQN
jgi:alpha-1,2-mannosyltransferase